MTNERLQDALYKAQITPTELAEQLSVDPKTVMRWLTSDNRAPYRRYRVEIARMLHVTESFLWPDALGSRANAISESEIVHIYPRRTAVPTDLWLKLFEQAVSNINILVYSGLFLPEYMPTLVPQMREKAQQGTKIEVLLGDPDCEQVAERGAEEGIGNAMAEKIRNSLSFYRPLKDVPGASVHFHRTTLYNSIYRFDDDMLVNGHLFGFPAAHAPVIHLRSLSGGEMFQRYAESFDRVWSQSVSAWISEDGKVGTWHG